MRKTYMIYLTALMFMLPGIARSDIHMVDMVNFEFVPAQLTINQGDTVMWTNTSTNMIHTSTSGTNCTDDGTWNSGNVLPGATYMRTFSRSGTFPYYCIPHCSSDNMVGTITVQAATSIEEPENAGAGFTGISPNPFRNQAVFQYELSNSANVVIEIYNLVGKQVKSIEQHMQSAGSHRTTFDTGNLPEGTYLGSLKINGIIVDTRLINKLR